MAHHSTAEEQSSQFSSSTTNQSQATKISPRTVLDSLSTIRIEKIRIKPIETGAQGRGGKADVIPAELVSAEASGSSHPAVVRHVAVKKLRPDNNTGDPHIRILALLAHETSILNNLSHPNIVKVIGFVEETGDGTAWIVLPWEKNGNLREFIASANWEFPERIALIYDVANGIRYLHGREPPICHGDLKSLNILVNSQNRAIITDFGSARSLNAVPEEIPRSQTPNIEAGPHPNTDSPKVEVAATGGALTLTGAQWTLRWAAPELLDGGTPSLASDVWAFGWICWEAMTSNFPFEGVKSNHAVMAQIIRRNFPPVHGDGRVNLVVALANLVTACWNLDPSTRPVAKSCEREVYWMDRTTPGNRNESGSPEVRSARLLTSLAHMHIRHGRWTDVMDLLDRAMNIARSTKDEWASADATHVLSEAYRWRGEYSKALESYINVLDMYAQLGSQVGVATVANRLGDIYHLQGEYSKAEESFVIARDIYTRIGMKVGIADAARGLGEVYRLRGECTKAEESFIASRDIYARIGNQAGLADSIKALGDVYLIKGEYFKAEESYVAARDSNARIGFHVGVAEAMNALGEIHRLRGEYSKAEEFHVASRDIYAEIKSDGGLADAVYGLGEVYRLREEYSKAEEFYITSRDLYTRTGIQAGLADVVKGLGDVYLSQREYFKAKESYVTARKLYADIGIQVGVAEAVNALGDLYCFQEEYSRAEESYVTARDIYVQIEAQGGVADAVYGLGEVCRLREEYSKAEEFYVASRDIYSQNGDKLGFANAITGLGQLLAMKKHDTEAEEFYREARDIYTAIGTKDFLAKNLCCTARLYESQKRSEEAKHAYSEASALYQELGLEADHLMCEASLEAVRKEKSKQ